MSKLIARRYEGHGRLCIEPQAFLELFYLPDDEPENRLIGDVAVVDIRGPLDATRGGWCDSYEAITDRVAAACNSKARAVMLNLDTPGGDAQGCFDCARELRAICAAAEKPLLAYAERANSAGYALASAASSITIGETSTAGSIGVISVRADYSAINAARGLKVAFITSGARKADGHPDKPLTDDELEAEQDIIDTMAGVFFQLVGDHRGLKTKTIEALQARVLLGAQAVKAGLADQVGTFKSALARVASGQTPRRTAMSKLDDAVAELREIAQGDGEDADTAAAMLAAAAESDPEKKDDEEEASESSESSESAKDEDEDESKKSAEDEDEEKESAEESAPSQSAAKGKTRDIALEALAKVHTLQAQQAKREQLSEKERLIATRKDFGKELRAALMKAPLSTVREMVKTLPRGPVAKQPKGDATTRAPARGQTEKGAAQGSHAASSATPREDLEDMERKLGMTASAPGQVSGIQRTPYKMTFGTPAKITPKPDSTPASN